MLNYENIAPWPYYEPDEIEAATRTLTSGRVNYWTGDLVKAFEAAYAEHVGVPYAIAVSNGTVALELALRALGVGAGDEVIVTSRSYVASATCVLVVGAVPVFADVEAISGNMSAETIAPHITNRTKAIIPVHVGGLPCEMDDIIALAKKHNVFVIEDCAQAHGATIDNRPVGAWGDAAIFSFCQDKIISTGGEGGMLLLNDESAYKTAWAYKDIGRSYDAVFNESHGDGFRWLTESVGSNYRMTEFQAAIGIKQLVKLPDWIARRNKHAESILRVVEKYDFLETIAYDSTSLKHAYYRLYVKVRPEATIKNNNGRLLRDLIIKTLNAVGVPCFVGSCAEIYQEQVFVSYRPENRYENASKFSDFAFCFLTHHTITDEQMKLITTRIRAAFDELVS